MHESSNLGFYHERRNELPGFRECLLEMPGISEICYSLNVKHRLEKENLGPERFFFVCTESSYNHKVQYHCKMQVLHIYDK